MATNRMMTDAEQTRIESIDEGAKILIWSGSQVIAGVGSYDFYSALLTPINSAQYVKFYITIDGGTPETLRTASNGCVSGATVDITSSIGSFLIENTDASSITITSIFMYLN